MSAENLISAAALIRVNTVFVQCYLISRYYVDTVTIKDDINDRNENSFFYLHRKRPPVQLKTWLKSSRFNNCQGIV